MTPVRAVPVAQGSPQWHALRRRRYGASEIGALAGCSAYQRPADVWLSKLGKSTRRDSDALFLRVGHLLESLAREEWIRATGREAEQGPVLAETSGYLSASLDSWTPTTGYEPIDAKSRSRGSPEWRLWSDGTIPEDVALQLVQQAILTERLTGQRIEACHIAAILNDGFGFEFRPLRLALTDDWRDYHHEIAETIPRWHAAYVAPPDGVPVPPPDATYRDVAVAVDVGKVKRRDATDTEAALLAAWAEQEERVKVARDALKAAEEARDVPKSDLARSMGLGYVIPGVGWTKHATPQLRLTNSKE